MVFLFWFVGLLLVGLALPLIRRKVRPNMMCGLRVAETLENEEVWFEANARSGWDLLWLGIGIIVVSTLLFVLPWFDSAVTALVCCGILVAGVIVYAIRGTRIAKAVSREGERQRRPAVDPAANSGRGVEAGESAHDEH